MAVKESREVVIEATPAEILDVIADVEATPTWSHQYQSSEVIDRYDDGRPKQAKMVIKAAGLTDTPLGRCAAPWCAGIGTGRRRQAMKLLTYAAEGRTRYGALDGRPRRNAKR